MKKITIAILMLLGTFSMASAELGVNVGVSANTGVFTAKGNEAMGTDEGHQYDRAISVFGYGSVFIEKTLGDYITVGVDYNPDSLDSETATQVKDCEASRCTQTIKVSFEDMTTGYIALNLTENFYVKAGVTQVDVISQESLDTGGTYGNTSLDGTMFRLGFKGAIGDNAGYKLFYEVNDFDTLKLTSTGNSVAAETNSISADLDVDMLKFALSYNF